MEGFPQSLRLRFIGPLSLLTVAAVCLCWQASAAPPDFQNEVVIASGITLPTALEFLPDGRMLVAEFTGRVVVVQSGAAQIDTTPVLQLVNIIGEDATAGGERGLVNVIADPAFPSNGYIYLFYTAAVPQRDRVSRFTMSGNTADLESEIVIWQGVADSTSTDHHGGALAFGADGMLYISTGDNGDPSSSQSLSSDHGKVLRVNLDGTVPTENPFFDGPGPNIDAIWALGLRNPFRMSFDPPTSRLYIGDVGAGANEEIDIGVAGQNYGWPLCEGPCGVSGTVNPIFFYNHAGRDGSVTAGFVYRGSQFPSSYQGVFFYGDYAQNWIRYLTLDGAGNVTGSVNFEPTDGSLDGPFGDPVMFKMGPDGSLYYVDFGFGPENPAAIRRIRYTAANQPPTVSVSATPTSGPAPLPVNFSSSGSTDPEGDQLTYNWTFGDGGSSTEPNPAHVYQQNGVYVARLALSDGVNTTQSDAITISVGVPPTGNITTPSHGSTFRAGDVIAFSGNATDPDGSLTLGSFSWLVLFHHDSHVHPALGPLNGTTSGSFTIPTSGHDFDGNTRYEIIMTVTDSDGLQHRSSVFVFPERVTLTFDSNPSGLNLALDGVVRATPFVKDALIGFQYTVNAPNQNQGTFSYTFNSWSDGWAQNHMITVPDSAQSYIATFESETLLPAGLAAAYGFEEGTGVIAGDASGNGHTATLDGPTWNTGKVNGGLSFDGLNDFVSLAASNSLELGASDFTIAVWIKRDSIGTEDTILSKSEENSWATGGKELFLSGTDNRIYLGTTGIGEVSSTGMIIADGLWHHVAVSFTDSSNVASFFLDGQASGGGTLDLGPDIANHVIKLGANPPHFFHGQMDEFRIYDAALTQSEIQIIMNVAVTPRPTINPGQLIISEFRFRGPGNSGAAPELVRDSGKRSQRVPIRIVPSPRPKNTPDPSPAANNEFIEFYNATDTEITVATTDGSSGWALVGADGTTRFTIPNGTVIPARSHFLAVNSVGYSLADYGGANAAAGDITYTTDIPDNGGIALFRTANPANFTVAERLDAAGYAGVNPLYREGTGFITGGAETTSNLEYSFFRDLRTTGGLPKDTDNNAPDFLCVDTQGSLLGSGRRLGAPGPENLSAAITRNAALTSTLLDASVDATTSPNRVRNLTSDPGNNSTFGTLAVRRTFINNTGAPITRLRFRIMDITTFPAPSGTADLRVLHSTDIQVTINSAAQCAPAAAPCTVNVNGTTLENLPAQPNIGGWNSSLSVGTITLATPLAAGQSVSVQFLLGVQQTGSFRFFLNFETSP